jgi:hypothetical protein
MNCQFILPARIRTCNNSIDFARRSDHSVSVRTCGTNLHFRETKTNQFVKMLNFFVGGILVMSAIWWIEALESFSRASRINSSNCSLVPSWFHRGITGPARAPRDSRHRRIRHCQGIKDLNKSRVNREGRHPLLVELEDKTFCVMWENELLNTHMHVQQQKREDNKWCEKSGINSKSHIIYDICGEYNHAHKSELA